MGVVGDDSMDYADLMGHEVDPGVIQGDQIVVEMLCP